ncbi:MAG: hypothetical protein K8J08_15755, partial [Thermoanaerobaculia bacterium]|nr:hypothetical protein [Thermoanaerobaculia bacterium]
MDLLPAIDLREGSVVRLLRGSDAERTEYFSDPTVVLQDFARAGAQWTHVVDLDAAFGEPRQLELLQRLIALPDRPNLQLGGGLRDERAVESTLALGVERVVIGSMVVRDFALFRSLVERFPGRIVPALDIQGEAVRVDGWREEAEEWRAVAQRLVGLPCPAVLVTDISRDGVLGGPNLQRTVEVARVSGIPALVSGGVANIEDVTRAVRLPEIGGIVFGKALYEGAIDLGEALEVAGGTDLTARIIPCLDVDAGRVVKGIRFLELQDMGDPAEAARRYADQGADELVFLDVSATFEDRDTRRDWVTAVAQEVFVPLTVGGGVRKVEDARLLLKAGADKVAVNSAAVSRPE